jgi:hypothetical protein
VATALNMASGFCSTCGFPLRGVRCEVCGGDGTPLVLEDAPRRSALREVVDGPGLERAVEAWQAGDFVRAIGQCVSAEGGPSVRSVTGIDGPGWAAIIRGGLVFVSVLASSELLVEAPIARLPSLKLVPALRLALELSERDALTSRVGLRRDLLLLRFVGRLSSMGPPLVRRVLREAGQLAAAYAEQLAVGFDARPAVPEELWSTVGWEAFGHPRRLQNLTPPAPARSSSSPSVPAPRAPAPAPSAPSAVAPAWADVPFHDGAASGPKPRAPAEPFHDGPASGPKRRASAEFSASRPSSPSGSGWAAVSASSEPQDLPPILAPAFAGGGSSASEVAAFTAPGSGMAAFAAPPRSNSTSRMSAVTPRRGAQTVPDGASIRSTSSPAVLLDDVDEMPTRRAQLPRDDAQIAYAERLCDLLRQAQSLGKLALEKRPPTMMWLIRATVYRAVYEFGETVPAAVAHLYRCTAMGVRDTAPGSRRHATQPIAEPALVVFDRILAARGNLLEEKPLELEPMTSAAQAKEHAARYLEEIERAPVDPSLRHFLALGALTELLVRTKLAPQTDQRLRDIVAHAQKEGAKPAAIDLMSTALQRIAAG